LCARQQALLNPNLFLLFFRQAQRHTQELNQ